jgi:tRNA threonylcarbamoyl adenosine modification protein (Sua5/YciO/YrdC/YwlC family)
VSQYFQIHPVNPQLRLIRRSVELLREGAVIVYPTDSSYALGCLMGNKTAMDRIRKIRQVDNDHNFTLVCRDLSEIATYAKVDNIAYRLLKNLVPGPYTFIFKATNEVPRRLQHPKRKTIGIRVPDHPIALALLDELSEPIMSSTLILAGESVPMTDPEDMRARLQHHVDLVIDGESCGFEPTTVIDFQQGSPEIIRQGRGDAAMIE